MLLYISVHCYHLKWRACWFTEALSVVSDENASVCVCVCEKGCLHGGQRRNRLLFGLNHHTLGDQVKCQMLFVQLVKWLEESERERERETQGQEYTDTTCHDEGQMGGSRDVIPRVKYSDWEACVTSSVACVCVFRCVWRYICSNVSLLISNNSIWRET